MSRRCGLRLGSHLLFETLCDPRGTADPAIDSIRFPGCSYSISRRLPESCPSEPPGLRSSSEAARLGSSMESVFIQRRAQCSGPLSRDEGRIP